MCEITLTLVSSLLLIYSIVVNEWVNPRNPYYATTLCLAKTQLSILICLQTHGVNLIVKYAS